VFMLHGQAAGDMEPGVRDGAAKFGQTGNEQPLGWAR
jgi:hypothetical protein